MWKTVGNRMASTYLHFLDVGLLQIYFGNGKTFFRFLIVDYFDIAILNIMNSSFKWNFLKFDI